jgi:hypothetical protein
MDAAALPYQFSRVGTVTCPGGTPYIVQCTGYAGNAGVFPLQPERAGRRWCGWRCSVPLAARTPHAAVTALSEAIQQAVSCITVARFQPESCRRRILIPALPAREAVKAEPVGRLGARWSEVGSTLPRLEGSPRVVGCAERTHGDARTVPTRRWRSHRRRGGFRPPWHALCSALQGGGTPARMV